MILAALGALSVALLIHLNISSALPAGEWLALALGQEAATYDEVLFVFSAAPRAAMAALVGGALGLASSVLQQVTLNRLVSPLTIGASAGAWLALVAGTVAFPAIAAVHGFWFAMAGAAAATALVLGIGGQAQSSSMTVVLAGMAVNILFTSLASVLVLLNGETVGNIFIWGAGDLTQNGWDAAVSLAPQLACGLCIILLLRRPLDLMRIGASAAGGRGLSVQVFLVTAALVALWMAAAAVSNVGIIGFVGLIAPNLARAFNARTAADEIVASVLIGAALLICADGFALTAEGFTRDIVPTGAAAALIGAPALIVLLVRRSRGGEASAFSVPVPRLRHRTLPLAVAAVLAILLFGSAILLGPTSEGWRVALPGELPFALRWPRVLAAAAAGAGMAVSGVILQRLLRNPLASPDIIGISSGASLAVVGAVVVYGMSTTAVAPAAAMAGGLLTLALLLVIGRWVRYAPTVMTLAGVSLAAALDAALRFALAHGGEDAYRIVGWLAGSTFGVTLAEAWTLVAIVAVLALAAFVFSRPLTLLGAGDQIAAGRGLRPESMRATLLAVAATLAAAVTAFVGPVAFVGLLGPHLALLLGARTPTEQVALASLIGVCLFLAADWIGRTLLYPQQIPAGAVASIVGGVYLLVILLRRRSVS